MKFKYASLKVVDLSSGADLAHGANCYTGSTATNCCGSGAAAGSEFCLSGECAGFNCMNGFSPQSGCNCGASPGAYGCGNGSCAGYSCVSGGSPSPI